MKSHRSINAFVVLAIGLAALGSAAPSATPAIRTSPPVWDDQFDGETLDPVWYWVNEDPDRWTLTESPGSLRIYASPLPTGGEDLLLRAGAEGNLTIETHVLFEPSRNFQLAGLVIFQDGSNFLQLGRAFCDLADICVGNGIACPISEKILANLGITNVTRMMTEIPLTIVRIRG